MNEEKKKPLVPPPPSVPPVRPTLPTPPTAPAPMPPKPPIPDIKPPKPTVKPVKPHVFVKITSYREIMERIEEIKASMHKLAQLLSEMAVSTRREEEKIATLGQILNSINQNLQVVDDIFSEPEE
ncbi:MAG: hypothetical protein J7L59_03340 [Nanoarchaeota archaeon]|nr:hypothetical protein [Nanoarchaeota archaeon]